MPFQIKQNTLNLSVPIERLAGAYYRIQRTKQNISLSCLAKELRMNKGFLSDLENGKRHFPDGLCKQIDSILNRTDPICHKTYRARLEIAVPGIVTPPLKGPSL